MWQYGFVLAWLSGCHTVLWLCGSVAVWPGGGLAVWLSYCAAAHTGLNVLENVLYIDCIEYLGHMIVICGDLGALMYCVVWCL